MQGIEPVFQVENARSMIDTHRRLGHGLPHISHSALLRSNSFPAKKSGQHRHKTVGGQGATRHLIASEDGDIDHWEAPLQVLLTTGNIIGQGPSLREPRLVALEEKADSIECHAGFLVCVRVVGEDMEEQAVHAQRKVAVEQCLDGGRGLIPHATHLGKALGLHILFTIDMGTADSVEHVIGLVVSRRIEPELTHGYICMTVMLHTIGHHRGSHALGRKAHSVVLSLAGNGAEEHILQKIIHGKTDVAQHLLIILHRIAGENRHVSQQVVAAALLKFLGEMAAPVLRTALPGVYVHELHYR